MAKQTWDGPLENAGENMWRIPRDYKPGMQVPGIILAGSQETPGFAGAGVVASVQELATPGEGDDVTIRKSDVKAFVIDNNMNPEELFSREDLASSTTVLGIIDAAVAEGKIELETENEKLTKSNKKLVDEVAPHRSQIAIAGANKYMDEHTTMKALTKGQADAVRAFAVEGIEASLEGVTDAQMAKLVDGRIERGVEFVKAHLPGGDGGEGSKLPDGSNDQGSVSKYAPDIPQQ